MNGQQPGPSSNHQDNTARQSTGEEKHGNEMPEEGDLGCAFPEVEGNGQEGGNSSAAATRSDQKHADNCGENMNNDPQGTGFRTNTGKDEGPQGNPAGGI